MLRLAIDGRFGEIGRGMGNYVRELVNAFAKSTDEFTLLIFLKDGRNVSWIPDDKRITIRILRAPHHIIWEQILFPLALYRAEIQVLHCPALTAPLTLPRSIKLILTIHDLIFLLPQSEVPRPTTLFHRLQWTYYSFFVPLNAKRANRIIVDSESSARDVKRFLGFGEPLVQVIPLAASSKLEATDRQPKGTPNRFFLALGADDPRKLTRQIVAAFRSLSKHCYNEQLNLVVTGATPKLASFFSSLPETNVTLLNYVDDQELAWLYRHCDGFLYPSLYEGFGLPVLEAMIYGALLITVRRASIPEVAGTCAVYVEPTPAGIEAGMQRVLEMSQKERLERVRAGMERSKEFSWQRTAQLTYNTYMSAVDPELRA